MGRTERSVHPEHAARLQLAIALGDAARAIAMRHYDPAGVAADDKADGSPVTIADRAIEEHVRAAVEREFPGDGIVGEEFGTRESRTGFTWVIDPIDGTRSFARGIPTFSTLIAVLEGERAVVGYASMPAWGECVHAARGGGAWWAPAPESPPRTARVSDQRNLAHALVETVQPHGYFEIEDYPAFERLARAVWRTRGWNDAYAYILCATGRVDAAVDLSLKVWDVAPFSVIIEEAGGVLSDWRGDTSRIPTRRVLMSNPHLHGALCRVLRGE
jgi:histidinol phosphatase-like enzyme (inositol monophosphatase family)